MQVGPDYRLMIDCYMSLDVPYAINLANAVIFGLKKLFHHTILKVINLLKKHALGKNGLLVNIQIQDMVLEILFEIDLLIYYNQTFFVA